MAEDARFEDVVPSDRPLKLKAESAEDLAVISALAQDAVGHAGDIKWLPRKRRLVLLLYRFRWEDRDEADKTNRPYERVRTALSFDSVLKVRARGLPPNETETIVSLLAVTFDAAEDGSGRVRLHLAGDGEIEAQVECLDALLADLTQPWTARSATAPGHVNED